jgi:poly(3-hydroxybutyrate) depolymerase
MPFLRTLTSLFFLFIISNVQIHAQTRYIDDLFSNIRKRTYFYADTLKLDFYDSKLDTASIKPLIVLVHGGGFVAGQRNGGEETTFGETFAKKGFAVASISYRLSRKGKGFDCNCPAATKVKTYVEAVDDLNKAIYYLTTYATKFNIDPDNIILVGSSAGAETILNKFILKDNFNFKPVAIQQGKIIGAISFSGATLDADYLTSENAVPMLFIHGRMDNKVPYASASHHLCNSNTPGYLILDGPSEIVKKLRSLNTSYELYSDPEGGHERADFGFQQTDLVKNFIYNNILKKIKVQREEIISKLILKK